jgi:uncharacterized protein YggU (UPF0235/DUF167 family)
MVEVRIAVRVRPGAARTKVGGSYGDPPQLTVAVNSPPVDGAANAAVVKAVAAALELRPSRVTVVTGHTARSKVLAVDVDDATEPDMRARVLALLTD